MTVYKAIGKFLKIGTLISTLGLIASVLLQIFARFFLENTPSWTEEASRLFFIYAVSFASGIALKNNSYVGLDLFYNLFNEKIRKLLDVLIPLFTCVLFGIVMIYTFEFIKNGFAEKSPSMEIPMGLAFFSIFIMSITICLYACEKIFKALKKFKS